MTQHFLLSKAARTLTLAKVFRMSEDQAYETFREMRWEGGEPVCPHCGGTHVYEYRARRIFKCKACGRQFSVTSGTLFHSRKLQMRDYLAAVAIFCNGVKGTSALQLSRDLDVQYKTAFVLAHKLREVMAVEQQDRRLSGEVEIDGAYFGGYVKPSNIREERLDRRRSLNKAGTRQVVVAARERGGKLLTNVYPKESGGNNFIASRLDKGTVIYTDEAYSWRPLHKQFKGYRINHTERYVDGHITTNRVESFFSRLRRAEMGQHHSIAGPYLDNYADEMAWREDNRRLSNGEQFQRLIEYAASLGRSNQWAGYWQRQAKVENNFV
ncbi:MAG: IS1595 family transposase [Rhodospirillales bacterium CG15_BIG_FIL_POST_REV_8_21_14_020_66_15]|nr:MAG: IS1595 family transposase [Rhodospirillales bacterium CG15_BIG_FIL_POST_REV_8_21_14_020_66_15]